MANFCCNCKHWESGILFKGLSSFGICHDVTVEMKILKDSEASIYDEATLYTDAFFGCIHFMKEDSFLIDTDSLTDGML